MALPDPLPTDPFAWFTSLYDDAQKSESFDASRAAFSTASAEGRPSARFVLVKVFDERGFAVFTNLLSQKARDLEANPFGSLLWHWSSTGVQVRAEGAVRHLPADRADAYFAARPRGSQVGAWASPQSSEIASRSELVARVAAEAARFEGQDVPRPEFWGGYLLVPDRMEFWFDGADRLHDRFAFSRPSEDAPFECVRLAP